MAKVTTPFARPENKKEELLEVLIKMNGGEGFFQSPTPYLTNEEFNRAYAFHLCKDTASGIGETMNYRAFEDVSVASESICTLFDQLSAMFGKDTKLEDLDISEEIYKNLNQATIDWFFLIHLNVKKNLDDETRAKIESNFDDAVYQLIRASA